MVTIEIEIPLYVHMHVSIQCLDKHMHVMYTYTGRENESKGELIKFSFVRPLYRHPLPPPPETRHQLSIERIVCTYSSVLLWSAV